jgi:hypothetical protein
VSIYGLAAEFGWAAVNNSKDWVTP